MAKCAFHSEKEAVEKCVICGKDMCRECAPKFYNELAACPLCSKEQNAKEKRSYTLISFLVGFGIVLALAVITLLAVMIARDGRENFYRNIGVMFAIIAILGLAILMLIKSIQSLKYYGTRYKIALNYEQTALTTTEAEPQEESLLTTTNEEAPKAKAKATTTARAKKPVTAKEQTKPAAKTAKTAAVKETTTSTPAPVKKSTSSRATTTATKEVKTVKKATTTAKKTTAKKAAEK